MTVDDGDIRSLLLSRADRADAHGLRMAAVEAARATPQLRPLVRLSSLTRRAWPVRAAAAIVALVAVTGAIALVIGVRLSDRDGTGAAVVGASPTVTPRPVPTPSPTDMQVTAPPYVSGSCPVTPITDLAGGLVPEVVTGGIRWRWGPLPWEADVGQKVVFAETSPDQVLDASAIIAERLPIETSEAPVSIRYPRGGGPGFVFGVGLPEPGCWLLTAIGPTIRSSVVVQAAPAPANPPSAESQNVPTERASLVPLAQCPTSPLVSGAAVRTWLDGDNRWQDPDPSDWVAGVKRKLVVSGVVSSMAPYELVVAARVGIVGPAESQRSAFVADRPVFTAPTPGSGSKAMELILPTAGCWAITYVDPTATSTIVVEIAATPSVSFLGPPAVADRTLLPSCGAERFTTPEGPWNEAARVCFWDAYRAQRTAEFVSTWLTTEGDPITSIYRVLGAGRVEIFIDSTQDRFAAAADRGWQRLDCSTLATVQSPAPAPDFGPDNTCVATPLH